MKKIINNKVYDTDTAKHVATWDDGYEELYQKRTGEFFIFSDGGAGSKYAGVHGDNNGRDRAITPIMYEDAQRWAKEHLTTEKYDEIFGEPEDNGSRTVICTSLTTADAERIKKAAAKAGVSISEFIVTKCLDA